MQCNVLNLILTLIAHSKCASEDPLRNVEASRIRQEKLNWKPSNSANQVNQNMKEATRDAFLNRKSPKDKEELEFVLNVTEYPEINSYLDEKNPIRETLRNRLVEVSLLKNDAQTLLDSIVNKTNLFVVKTNKNIVEISQRLSKIDTSLPANAQFKEYEEEFKKYKNDFFDLTNQKAVLHGHILILYSAAESLEQDMENGRTLSDASIKARYDTLKDQISDTIEKFEAFKAMLEQNKTVVKIEELFSKIQSAMGVIVPYRTLRELTEDRKRREVKTERKRKEAERLKLEEELKNKEEERLKLEEELKNKEEERLKLEEELKNKEEERLKLEEELKNKEEELKNKEEELKKKEEELKKKEEEHLKLEEERKKKEEEHLKLEEELKKKEEEHLKLEEERKKKEEEEEERKKKSFFAKLGEHKGKIAIGLVVLAAVAIGGFVFYTNGAKDGSLV
ncbi:hypothetical protein ENBRE01_3126 [Enteropsectra breve]|nr:hypothetical protein ENBRE01_3126 [Enteropsectra breve]